MAEGEPERVSIPVVYIGTDDQPILFVNQFAVQHQQNEFVITVGQFQTPIILGETDEEKLQRARELAFVPIKVVARLGLTRARIGELIEALQANVARYDAQQQRNGG
jgi:hypothetical protein